MNSIYNVFKFHQNMNTIIYILIWYDIMKICIQKKKVSLKGIFF